MYLQMKCLLVLVSNGTCSGHGFGQKRSTIMTSNMTTCRSIASLRACSVGAYF
ncbi:hypothetical protein PSPO01_14984 [Paraphaeosphaeria sporulosa]